MRNHTHALLLLVLLLGLPLAAWCDEKPKAPPTWQFEADNRLRVESIDWFKPPPGPKAENAYTFGANRLRLRLRYERPGLGALVELQDVQMIGLPTAAILPPPVGGLGPGASYYAYAARPSLNTAGIRQLSFQLGDKRKLSAQIGRFEYCSGLEQKTGEADLDWLLSERISQRLIGPGNWSDDARSFDGARADLVWGRNRLTGFAAHPTDGFYDSRFDREMSLVNISNVAWTTTLGPKKAAPRGELQVFWQRYEDFRPIPFTDNRPAPLRGIIDRQGGIEIDTVGAHYVGRIGRDGDILAWYAWQSGRWGHLTQASQAYAIELGLHARTWPGAPYFRVGYDRYSGDGNPSDTRHGTFFAPLAAGRQFARTCFYTIANLDDLFVQAVVKPSKKTTLTAGLNFVHLDQPQDLWYSGAFDVSDRRATGYSGRPSGGSIQLGTAIDLNVEHKFDDNQCVNFYIGHIYGGKTVQSTFPGRQNANYMYLEYILKLPSAGPRK